MMVMTIMMQLNWLVCRSLRASLHAHPGPRSRVGGWWGDSHELRGESTARYRWTGWVWEMTCWIEAQDWIRENYPPSSKNPWSVPQIIKGKPEDYNMWAVGLGNTKIWTSYAQKSLQTMGLRSPWPRIDTLTVAKIFSLMDESPVTPLSWHFH
jgi:hypothetical protein